MRFSGTAKAEPFSMVTQLGGLLVGFCTVPQPVWKPTEEVPVVTFPTMLKTAVNRSPLVGGNVTPVHP